MIGDHNLPGSALIFDVDRLNMSARRFSGSNRSNYSELDTFNTMNARSVRCGRLIN